MKPLSIYALLSLFTLLVTLCKSNDSAIADTFSTRISERVGRSKPLSSVTSGGAIFIALHIDNIPQIQRLALNSSLIWKRTLSINITIHTLTIHNTHLYIAGTHSNAVFVDALSIRTGFSIWTHPFHLSSNGTNAALALHIARCPLFHCLLVAGYASGALSSTPFAHTAPPRVAEPRDERDAFLAVIDPRTSVLVRLLYPRLPRLNQGVALTSLHGAAYVAINSFSSDMQSNPRSTIFMFHLRNWTYYALSEHPTGFPNTRMLRISSLVSHPHSLLYVTALATTNATRVHLLRAYRVSQTAVPLPIWQTTLSSNYTNMSHPVMAISPHTGNAYIMGHIQAMFRNSNNHKTMLRQPLSVYDQKGHQIFTWARVVPLWPFERITSLHVLSLKILSYTGLYEMRNQSNAMYGNFGTPVLLRSAAPQLVFTRQNGSSASLSSNAYMPSTFIFVVTALMAIIAMIAVFALVIRCSHDQNQRSYDSISDTSQKQNVHVSNLIRKRTSYMPQSTFVSHNVDGNLAGGSSLAA